VSEFTTNAEGRPLPAEIDSTVAHAARGYDYMLGGTDNFAVDRAAAEAAAAAVGGMDNVRAEVQANRAFLGRAVRYLTNEAAMRQFLDIGTGIPNANNVHAVAQGEAPESRVVYVDNDPIVLAHAHYLLKSVEPGGTRYIQADLRDTGSIIDQAADFLDLSQPVAVMLVGLLHHFRDEDDPYRLVARLMEAVPSGSYLAMSHLAIDIMPEAMAAAAVHLNEAMEEPWIPRTHAGVAKFFEGLEPVDPGVVQVDEWRNPDAPPPPPGWTNPLYVGVGRKP
jgi:hypothetical protein